jgi:non-heme chloroperoxidase
VNLSFEERGSGSPVVMVHGIPTDSRAWQSQLNDFSGSFRAIAISRRHAFPNKNDQLKVTESTVQRNSNDLISLIDSLKLAPIHLIGHSYGGFISLYSVWKRPELFRTLVLVEPAIPSILVKNEKSAIQVLIFLLTNFSAAMSARRLQNGNLKLALKAFDQNDLKSAVKYFYEGIREIPGSFDRLPDWVHAMMLDNGLTVGELETEFPILTKADARAIKLPTLMVKTENGPKWLRAIVDLLHRNLPNSSIVDISGSCHLPHIENPSAFNSSVLEFLRKNNQ